MSRPPRPACLIITSSMSASPVAAAHPSGVPDNAEARGPCTRRGMLDGLSNRPLQLGADSPSAPTYDGLMGMRMRVLGFCCFSVICDRTFPFVEQPEV